MAYLDTTIALLAATPLMQHVFADGAIPQRGHGPYTGQYAFYTTYETQDGKLLSVGCSEPWLWENPWRSSGGICAVLSAP